jgi:hypothetical protein
MSTKEKVYKCPICYHEYGTFKEKIKCKKSCNMMISCYMSNRKITRKEAIAQFRMEIL